MAALEKALEQKEHALIAAQQQVIEAHTQYQGRQQEQEDALQRQERRLRAVSGAQLRVNEIARLGFTTCILPAQNAREVVAPEGVSLLAAKNVREAIAALV